MQGLRIRITGTVQGVGFRPFIYNLAIKHGISGQVLNDVSGVEILAAGTAIDDFIQSIRTSPPPLARIQNIEISSADINEEGFSIIGSLGEGLKQTDIGIDAAVCLDCKKEMFDKNDRRYLYPFINCTNCGPRYTIMTDLPFDRKRTSMAPFPMCSDCLMEYNNPRDRRFHAQGNCCSKCGPQYNDIDKAVNTIQKGGIVAIKGIGGYHLACDADNTEAVLRLRRLKERDEKPFAVMISEKGLLQLSTVEETLLCGIERPIVLIDIPVFSPIAPGLNTLGVMLPYAPIHHLLFFKGKFKRLIMTSGNKKNEPMATRNGESVFKGIADFILEHDREIAVRNDDSVIRVISGAPTFIRRSRGYAPAPIQVDFDASGIIGCGAMLKNSIAMGRSKKIYVSQYIGDLSNEDTYESLANTYNHLLKMFGIDPKKVVCDLHPDYLSTRFAESLGIPVIRIQHHIAHAFSCMAENKLDKAVAVVYDGAGLGNDGNIWGGEIFSINGFKIIREKHLSYMPMPGGDACITHPLRLAAGILFSQGISIPGMEDVFEIIQKNINLFKTSGMGRLFDAVSALLLICTEQTYEGEAPMLLESASANLDGEGSYDITPFDSSDILKAVYMDTAANDVKAARFHNTIINMTADAVLQIAEEKNIKSVVLSGGCFQNRLLLEGLISRLKDHILVHTHRLVPPNDGGIAFGQIAAAVEEYK